MSAVEFDLASQFAKTYSAFYGRVHAYAARRVGSQAADDVAAETFLVAWRRADAIPAEPLPWLYGVARNIVLRHRVAYARQEGVRLALESEPRFTESPGGDDSALWDAWRQMSASDQETLALIAWEELSVGEAARSLGCPAAVFSVRLHRARKRFELLLEHHAGATKPVPHLSEAS